MTDLSPKLAASGLSEKKQRLLVSKLEQSYQLLYARWNRTAKAFNKQELEHLIRDSLELSCLSSQYNLSEVSDSAKELVLRLRWINSKGSCDSNDDRLVIQIMDSIKTHIESLKPNNIVTLNTTVHGNTLQTQKPVPQSGNGDRIAVMESNSDIASEIESTLVQAGYSVSLYDAAETLKRSLSEHTFDLIIVDLLLPNCPLASAMSVEEFLSHNPVDVPVIMLSEQADLSTRLIALRAGIKTYLTKPVDPEELIGKVQHILSRRSENRTRVMVVDDDPMLTEYYETALNEEGYHVKAINNPITLLEEIEQFKPDIITLDYIMPNCNGLELAEILRGDPRYMKIPIVFMSAAEEAVARKGLMGIFGNAFLEKPVDIDQLSDTIKETVAKSQKMRENFEKVSKRTSSESLENRDYFFSQLQTSLDDRVFRENIDTNHYLTLATLDDITRVKENYGSLALLKLEDKIEQYFSQHPLITGHGCKFGDHTYLLMIDDPQKSDSELLFKELIQDFKQQKFVDDIPANRLSLSVGVAKVDGTLPPSLEESIQLIENANISASNAGGDQWHWAAVHAHSDAPSERIYDALKNRSFQLAFQSIVKPDSKTQMFEALVRLVDAEGEVYTPEKFLPYIDDVITDGAYHLDRWVIENAFRSLETTAGRGAAEFSIVIKLSPDLKQVERLMPFIYNIVSNTRLRGQNRIYFSLSEKAVLSNIELSNHLVAAFKTAGCGFVIEHCQASEPSIDAIAQLEQVDFVKLAPTVASGNQQDLKSRLKALTRVLGEEGSIVAGLVEDAKTFAQFWDLNVRYFQGYFIHRPNNNMNQTEFEAESLVLEK